MESGPLPVASRDKEQCSAVLFSAVVYEKCYCSPPAAAPDQGFPTFRICVLATVRVLLRQLALFYSGVPEGWKRCGGQRQVAVGLGFASWSERPTHARSPCLGFPAAAAGRSLTHGLLNSDYVMS